MESLQNITNQPSQQAVINFDTKGYSQEAAKPQIPIYDAFIPMPTASIEMPQKPEIQQLPEKKKFDFEKIKNGLKNIPRLIGRTIGGTLGAVVGSAIGLLGNMILFSPVIIPFLPMSIGDKAIAEIVAGVFDLSFVANLCDVYMQPVFNTIAQIITSPLSLGRKGAYGGAYLLGEEIPNAIGTAFREAVGSNK